METIKGKEVFVLTTDWIDERSTIRQGVDTFEKEEEANAALKTFDEEVGDWVNTTRPSWKREGDGVTFVEYGKPGYYFDSHAVGKITKCVVK
jgi:hypothetical protein